MGCSGCSETERLKKANRLIEAALDGALGALADVQNALTERAINPTPYGASEEDLMTAISQLIKKYVSRETEAEHVEEEVPPTERTIQPVPGQDTGAKNPELDSEGAYRLGDRLQRNRPIRFGREQLQVGHRSLAAGRTPRQR